MCLVFFRRRGEKHQTQKIEYHSRNPKGFEMQITIRYFAGHRDITGRSDERLELAPGAMQDATVIDARALTVAVCGDWARASGLPGPAQEVLQVDLPAEALNVVFDAEHLRRVLVNLLDNARRHASGSAGAVQLRLHGRDANEAVLTLASDGAPIASDVERYLFEPFFSTRSRGSGLGLYICRELCERYGARIDYRLRPASERHRNEFSVAMRRQAVAG